MATDITSVNSSCSQSDIHGDTNTDVSALKIKLTELEKELKNLQVELDYSLENTGCAIRVINKDYTIRHINQAFADISEVKQAEVIGEKCWDVFASPFCHTPNCRLKRILQGEKSIQIEIVRQRKDNTSIPCSITANPLYNAEGELVGIIEQFRDITERRHFEEQIRESEDRYQALVQLGTEAGEAIVMLQDIDGLEGVQTFVSDQWLKITGYRREELLGMPFFNMVSLSDRASSLERHREKMAGQSIPGLFEVGIIRQDGTEVPIELTGAFTTYQDKRANVMYIRDISERKRIEAEINKAEIQIRNSAERYRSLFEDVPVAIWELDYTDVKNYIDKLRASGVDDFKQFFNNNRDEFLYCFNLRKVIGCNNAVVTLMEAVSKEQVLSEIQTYLERRPTGLTQDQKNLVALTEGATKIDYETYEPGFKNKWRNLSIEFMIAPGHENTWSRVFLTAFDITERVQAENVLMKYQETLEEKVKERSQLLLLEIEQRKKAEEKLSILYARETKLRRELESQIGRRIEFTRTLVHELKTPLTPMLGSSEILIQRLKDEKSLRIARNIHRGAIDLNNRISDLIDLNQGEMGIISLMPQLLNTATLLREIVDYVRPMAARKGQHLLSDIPDSLPAIYADEARLRQILLNLLENSFRYTPEHGSISLKAAASCDSLVIKVIDTGCGICKKDQAHIFKLSHSKRQRNDNRDGLGIGLPLCKMLVDLHKGKIGVESQRGKGSMFAFSIPIDPRVAVNKGAK